MAELSVLARIALFAELPAEDLADMAASLRPRRYARGQVIFFCGDPGTSLCIVEAGRVRLGFTSPDGKEIMLALFGPGDFFGELALLDGQPRSADAIAAEPSRLLLLNREDFRRALESRPRLAIKLLGVLSQRLRRDAQLLQDAAFLDVPGRLASVLLRLAEAPGPTTDGARAIPSRLTQTELAGMIGATRESISKSLAAFERRGLILRQNGRIVVLRPDELQRRMY